MSPKDAQFCEELIAGRTDRAALAKKMKVTGDSLPSYARRVSLALGFHRFLMDKQGSFSTLSMYLQVVTSQEYVDKLRREAVGVFKHT